MTKETGSVRPLMTRSVPTALVIRPLSFICETET